MSGESDLTKDIPAGASGIVQIDLDAIAGNWRALDSLVGECECAAVVKADGYGLGADRVIPALWNAGCKSFFIATPDEAAQARKLAPEATIYMLNGLMPGNARDVAEMGVVPVISSIDELRDWGEVAGERDERLNAALHVDSGLNRLGMSAQDIQALASDAHLMFRVRTTLVMSHLACADNSEHPKNEQQRAIFQRLRDILPDAPASLAASGGVMLGPGYHFDMVRPGYALYGGQAGPGAKAPVKPVVRIMARVLQVRDVAPGASVGYSATYQASEVRRIATIAAGYTDGMSRRLSAATGEENGLAAINGQLVPFAGRVSMDLITLDVTDIDDPPVQRGDFVELVGPNISIEMQGNAAGTIGYEVLTRLGARFHRVYGSGEI